MILTQSEVALAIVIFGEFLVCVFGCTCTKKDKDLKYARSDWFLFLMLFLYSIVPIFILKILSYFGISFFSNEVLLKIF